MDHKKPDASVSLISHTIEKVVSWFSKKKIALGAAALGATLAATGCATSVDAVPQSKPPIAGTQTPGGEPSPEASGHTTVDDYVKSVVKAEESAVGLAERTPTPSKTVSESAKPGASETAKSLTEEEAIQDALAFADEPLVVRQAEFLRVSKLALEAIDSDSNFIQCLSEGVGSEGLVLAAYNPLFQPGAETDSAVAVLGQKYFADQLADSMGSAKDPNILDKKAALQVLAGAYYDPLLSKDYIREAGLSEKQDYGTLNEKEVTIQSGISNITDIEFDATVASKIAPIVDSEGNPYPVRVVRHKTGSGLTIYDAVILVGKQWLILESTITEDKLSSTLTQLNSAYNQN